MVFVLNTLVSALVIAGVALVYLQHRDTASVFELAKSILVALPITVLFFAPFLMRDRLSFWGAYALGCALLPIGYFVHRALRRAIG